MEDKKTSLRITKLPHRETIIIKQLGKPEFFVSSYNVIAIELPTLAFLIKFLVQNNLMSKKVLEGILSELTE